MPQDKVLVFAATLNERENIASFVREVLEQSVNADLLIVDDNSTDQTGELLDLLSESEPRLKIVHRPNKLGLGSAHILAMIYAVKNNYDILVTMDADFSHDPKDIPRIVTELRNNDFVTGSRYVRGGSCDYVGYRQNISVVANYFSRLLLGIPTHEFTTSFRGFKVQLLRELNIAEIRSRGYSFFLETITRIFWQGFKIAEIPIHSSDRKAGESKIPKFEIFNGIYRLFILTITRIFRTQRYAQRKLVLPNISCYSCSSNYLIEMYPKENNTDLNYAAYKCTSMEHKTIPQVVACLQCGLDFVPERENLFKLYSEVVDEEYLSFKEARYKTFEVAYDRIKKYIPAKGKLFEVGSYCGFFMDVVRQNGVSIQGIEPSSWATKYAKEVLDLKVQEGSLENMYSQLAKDFDGVVMWDVLEHMSDPKGSLNLINGLLNEEGYLFLSTLDIDNWFPKIMGKKWPWLMPMHVFYFRTPALEYLLKQAGFRIVHSQAYSHYISLKYLMDKLMTLLPSAFRPILLLSKIVLPKKVNIPFFFGDIKLYICKKTQSEEEVFNKIGEESKSFKNVNNLIEIPYLT